MRDSAELPAHVQAYLRQATCLLPGSMRAPTYAELHANLYQAMCDARVNTSGEPEAWAAALKDAGPAWQVAIGLARVHTLGLALRAVLVGAALGGVTYAMQTGRGHPQPSLSGKPLPQQALREQP